jgi:hypothetical protein
MRRLVAAGGALLIAAGVPAACGGGGSAKAVPVVTSETNPGPGPGSLSSGELARLVAEAGQQRFKITYDSGGITQTYAQDGNGNTMAGDNNSETFTTKTAIIACDKSSGSYQCTEAPGSPGDTGNLFLGVAASERSLITIVEEGFGSTSTKTIAGRAAQCVTLSPKDIAGDADPAAIAAVAKLKGSISYCIDKDTGATLEASSTDASGKTTTSLIVTKFSAPGPDDFTPPATPSTIPTNITVPPAAAVG